MATRKRKSSKRKTVRRAAPRKVANKARRHASKRRTTRRVYASRRHHNPVHHRRSARRRHRSENPLGAAGSEIINFTVAGLAQGIAQPIIGGFAGRFLPFGQYNGPIVTAGTGWVLSKVFGMFGLTRRFAHASLVFGFAAAAMQVLQPIVGRALVGVGAGAPANPTMAGPGRRMVRGIGAMTDIPPSRVLPPPSRQAGNNANTMAGVGMRQGNWAR